MAKKEIIKGKRITTCDICGNEIPLDIRDNLSLMIQNNWWETFGWKSYDICKKHKKEIIQLIGKLKKDNLS